MQITSVRLNDMLFLQIADTNLSFPIPTEVVKKAVSHVPDCGCPLNAILQYILIVLCSQTQKNGKFLEDLTMTFSLTPHYLYQHNFQGSLKELVVQILLHV